MIFRRLPKFARAPKHLLGEPSADPYTVVGQKSLSNVVLKDSSTNESVDKGANIPLDQILAGPPRSNL